MGGGRENNKQTLTVQGWLKKKTLADKPRVISDHLACLLHSTHHQLAWVSSPLHAGHTFQACCTHMPCITVAGGRCSLDTLCSGQDNTGAHSVQCACPAAQPDTSIWWLEQEGTPSSERVAVHTGACCGNGGHHHTFSRWTRASWGLPPEVTARAG